MMMKIDEDDDVVSCDMLAFLLTDVGPVVNTLFVCQIGLELGRTLAYQDTAAVFRTISSNVTYLTDNDSRTRTKDRATAL
eukprot:scaffold10180_cov304-Chaetoceros_neogracile.AAC.5